jgi:translocation and assembly module TamB
MKRLAKWLAALAVALLMLLALAFLAVQTPLFKDWLRGQIEKRASAFLQADLRIGTLKGNLIGVIILSDISLSQDDSLLFTTEGLLVRYDPTALWRRTVQLHEVRLLRPQVVFDQAEDGQVRLVRLLNAAFASDDTTSQPRWEVNISQLAIQQARIDVLLPTRPPYLPRTIDPLDLEASLRVRTDTIRVKLEQLALSSSEPEMRFRFSPFEVELAAEEFALAGMKLATDSSEVHLDGRVSDFGNPQMHTRPLAFSDVAKLLPYFPMRGQATADLEVVGSLDHLEIGATVRSDAGQVRLRGTLGIRAAPYRVQLSGQLDRLDVGKILARPEWSSDLTVRFEVDGQGSDLPGATADVRVEVIDSRIAGREISSGRMTVSLRQDSLRVESQVVSNAGNVVLVGTAAHLQDVPWVQGEMIAEALNLSALPGLDTLETSINGRLRAEGFVTGERSFDGSASLELTDSKVRELVIDQLGLRADLVPGAADVDTFFVRVGADVFSGKGRLSAVDESDFRFSISIPDLEPLGPWLWTKSAEATIRIDGRVSGRLDTALVVGGYEMEDYEDETGSVRYLTGNYQIQLRDTVFFAVVDGEAAGIVAGPLAVDDLRARVQASADSMELAVEGNLFGESDFQIAGTLIPGDTSAFRLRSFSAEFNGQRWSKPAGLAQLRWWDDVVEVRRFELSSGDQRVRMAGRLSVANGEDFSLSISSLQIGQLLQTLTGEGGVTGSLDAELRLLGTADQPRLAGSLLLQDGSLIEFNYDSVRVVFGYDAERLDWQLRVVRDTSQVLTGVGFLPVNLAWRASGRRLLDRPMMVRINTGGMDLSFLQTFIERVEDLEGRFAAHIVLENTPFQPRGRGPITVYDGAFTLPEYGIRLRNIAIRAQLNGTRMDVSQFKMESGPGRIEGTGALSLSREGLDQFALDLRTSNFEIMRNDTMRAKVNGKLRISGSLQQPRVEGELTLADATIFLEGFEEEPALVATNAGGTSPLFSLGVDTLVIRREETAEEATEEPRVAEVRRTIGPRFDLYERLRGRIRLRIPRNTWVRSSAANFEIEGLIELVKDGPDFVLFGPVEIVRGTYEVAGNRFQITEGEIVFQGEEDYNAQVKIVAEYRFTTYRDGDRLAQRLKLVIEGTAYQPKLTFYHDDREIEEKDFLAYLFFGQPFDALLSGEQSTLSQTSLSQRATSLFGGLLAQQLGKALGQAFRLDVVDIRREGSQLQQTTVSVGKYIAPNLFLSLSQDFAGGRRVVVEYEVFRRFFIQMLREQWGRQQQDRTAFDVIWKIDW